MKSSKLINLGLFSSIQWWTKYWQLGIKHALLFLSVVNVGIHYLDAVVESLFLFKKNVGNLLVLLEEFSTGLLDVDVKLFFQSFSELGEIVS